MAGLSLASLLAFAVTSLAIPSPHSLGSDLTIVLHNDLYGTKSARTNAAIVLGRPENYADGVKDCAALGETLWTAPKGVQGDFIQYLGYSKQGPLKLNTNYWVGGKTNGSALCPVITPSGQSLALDCNQSLPVICTQSANLSNETAADSAREWRTAVRSGKARYVGYRDKLSFRFLGIRYGTFPQRFTYSDVHEASGNISALELGPACIQGQDADVEDCLYLNIWSPYLPMPAANTTRAADKEQLKPVMLWIHGGGFHAGTGSDPNFDGGNMASRGDVVVVTINYRLGTLGFLALDDGVTNGNYGLADQVTALSWVQAHIRDFGGDPDRITIFGQSAGAASVRALLGSSEAKGKFHAAIMMSNLGGKDYASTFSQYQTIGEEAANAQAILNATKCTGNNTLACLRAYDATDLVLLSAQANVLVVDGKYITSKELVVNKPGQAANVPVMMGLMRDDGAPFIKYPSTSEVTNALRDQSVNASAIVQSGLFPTPNGQNATTNVFNVTSLVSTDIQFRCIDQATAISAAKHSVFPKVYFYEFNRGYQISWNPNPPTCNAPPTGSHPNGDPSLEYFKCHSGELYYVFGVIDRMGLPARDDDDIPFSQLIVDSWTSFARTFDPNPDPNYLSSRGFRNTTAMLESSGKWAPVDAQSPTLKHLMWPSKQVKFDAGQRCALLGLPYDYYEGH